MNKIAVVNKKCYYSNTPNLILFYFYSRAILDAKVKELHVIEKDPRFLPTLKLIKSAVDPGRLHINIGDCLHFNTASM